MIKKHISSTSIRKNSFLKSLIKYSNKKTLIYLSVVILIIIIMALIEFFMGRIPICECGYVKIWTSDAFGSENSQHLFDYYALTHIIHGIIFYFLIWLFFRKMSPEKKFLLAVAIECAWEILENTPLIIDRYRAATIALNYYGDSIINSIGDVIAMILGYLLAKKSRIWISIAIIIGLELLLAFIIRDNLSLNIITLLYPSETILQWQSAINLTA